MNVDVDPMRSRIMSSVGQKRTKPEMAVRRALHALGYRFRVNMKGLPGSPDLVFTKRRKAIFVHGCFWHRHPGCRYASEPKTRREFWQQKFSANIERDARQKKELEELGWKVETVWECETRDPDRLIERLRLFLGNPRIDRYSPHKIDVGAAASLSPNGTTSLPS